MVPRLGIGSLLLIAGLRGASRDSPLIDQSPVAITGVTVVDVASGGLLPNETVIIDGGKIIAMGPATSTPPPSGSRRVDGTGKYLIPGLWDMHTHLTMTGRSALKLFLANGVTGVRDMGGDPGVVLPWRDSIAAGSLEGPRILAAGSIVESASWLNAVLRLAEQLHSPELEAELRLRLPIETTTDGIRDVDSLVALRADFLKIRNFPSPAAYWALARAARGHGLRITGHSPPASELGPVSDSGFASFEHSIISVRNDTLIDAFDGMTESQRGELFHRFAKNGTAYDPTLVSSKARFVPDSAISRMIGDSAGASVPTLRYVSGAIRMAWRTQLAMRAVEGDNNWGPIYRSNLRDIREMAAAGVLILAGTDVPVVTLIPGFSLPDELDLLVHEAGLTPLQALQAATRNPAVVLGLAHRLGEIAVGRLADLVLLDANPLADIRATRAVRAVVVNGHLYDRRDLDRLLAHAR